MLKELVKAAKYVVCSLNFSHCVQNAVMNVNSWSHKLDCFV